MIALSEFRKLLGAYGKTLSDEQVKEIRDQQYQLAGMAFRLWADDKHLENQSPKHGADP